MRFSQVDILIDIARNIGGAIMAISIVSGLVNWLKLERGDVFLWPIWVSGFLAGLSLIVVCTGVLAQIVTARATQDSLFELRKIRAELESTRKT
jgi:hypothetical protein